MDLLAPGALIALPPPAVIPPSVRRPRRWCGRAAPRACTSGRRSSASPTSPGRRPTVSTGPRSHLAAVSLECSKLGVSSRRHTATVCSTTQRVDHFVADECYGTRGSRPQEPQHPCERGPMDAISGRPAREIRLLGTFSARVDRRRLVLRPSVQRLL